MKSLKKPTAKQKGLKKLPRAVRNKMGYAKDGMKYNKGGKMKKMSKIGQVSKSQADAIHRKAYMETDKALHERSDELKSKGRKGYSETQMAYSANDAGNKAVKDAKSDAAKRLQVPNPRPEKSLKMKKGGKLKGANKATKANTHLYKRKEHGEYRDGAAIAGASFSGRRGAKLLRKEGLAGTPQNPSPAMGGARAVASMLGEKTDTIPMRKRQLGSVSTAGAKKNLKGRTSGKSGNVGSGIKLDPKKKRRR